MLSRRRMLAVLGSGMLVRGDTPRSLEPPALFRQVPAARERHHVGPRERPVAGTLAARIHVFGMRVSGLRQRRLDGHLPCEYRPIAVSTSRPSPPRNALYRNNRDGTFTDVTAKAGLDGERWGEGVAVGDLQRRWLSRHVPHLLRQEHPVPQQRRRHVYRCNGEGRSRAARMVHVRRLVRLRQRRQARPVRLQLRGLRFVQPHHLRR